MQQGFGYVQEVRDSVLSHFRVLSILRGVKLYGTKSEGLSEGFR